MQTARLNADVEDGLYDGRLGELLQNDRVLFRLEALDGIARERVNSLRRADPDADVSYAGFWVTRRSGGVVFRHLDDLDAVFESDTCADLRQLICAFQPPPGL